MRSLLGAPLPRRARKGDAGYDIFLPKDVEFIQRNGKRVTIDTGICMEEGDIPEGHFAMILPRSSAGMKWGVTLMNSVGIIDSGYRDPIKLGLWLNDPGVEILRLKQGDRIAQMIIVPFATIPGEEAPTEERDGGLGSTGN